MVKKLIAVILSVGLFVSGFSQRAYAYEIEETSLGVENRAIGMLDTLEKMNVVLTTETKDKIISLMSKYEVYELRQEDETVIISVQNSYPVINQKTSGKTYERNHRIFSLGRVQLIIQLRGFNIKQR